MSVVMKQSNSNSWYLVLAIIVVAVVCQIRRPDLFTTGQSAITPAAVSRAESQRANLESTVSNSIGIDQSRGDAISVVPVNP